MPNARPSQALALNKLPTPNRGQCDFWDRSLRCFGVRCSQGGSKTYILKLHNTRVVLGRVGIITLKQAREEARRRLALKYLPHLNTVSVKDAAQEYLEAKKKTLKPRTITQITYHLSHLPPATLHALTSQQVFACIQKLPNGASHNAFANIKTFLNWCFSRQYLHTNPLQNVNHSHKIKARERVLTDNELHLIWRETLKHGAFGRICRLLMLSGQRLNQIASLKKEWISQDTITFPASIMKSNTEHVIPLVFYMKNLLLRTTGPYCFGPDKPFKNASTSMKKFRAALPDIPHFTCHDFRRTFSTNCARWEICPLDITEAILDHTAGSRNAIQRIYDRHDRLPQMRRALMLSERKLPALVQA